MIHVTATMIVIACVVVGFIITWEDIRKMADKLDRLERKLDALLKEAGK